jgi:gamma-glutamyltranspeptidase
VYQSSRAGAAAAWIDTVEKLGSGNVTIAEVLAPAIRLAEEGVPVSEINGYAVSRRLVDKFSIIFRLIFLV